MKLNITDDAKLDKFHLDDEAQALPSTIARYHEAVNEATEELTDLRISLEKEEAVARMDARNAFTANGIKCTVDMVNDAVTSLPAIIQLKKEVAEAERKLTYLKAGISMLDAKRSSLNNLVSLYIKDYYNTQALEDGVYREADVKRRNSQDYTDRADRQTQSLAKALKRRSQNNG